MKNAIGMVFNSLLPIYHRIDEAKKYPKEDVNVLLNAEIEKLEKEVARLRQVLGNHERDLQDYKAISKAVNP